MHQAGKQVITGELYRASVKINVGHTAMAGWNCTEQGYQQDA